MNIGKWVKTPKPFFIGKEVRPKGEWELVGTGFIVCSCCNRAIGQAPIGKPNFCPNCGADMRGKE